VNVESMSNKELWEEWTDAMESMAQDPQNGYARRSESDCLNEMVRRMQEASKRPLVRQEAQA
jgi:hypothetical protein